MINFFKACLFTATIWVVAALLNALLYSVVFVMGNIVQRDFNGVFGLSFCFSLVFSAPGIFCFWLVFVTNTSGQYLSKKLLKAAFIISLCSCGFIAALPPEVYRGHWFLLGFIIVASSVTSVMLHHRLLQTFKTKTHNHV